MIDPCRLLHKVPLEVYQDSEGESRNVQKSETEPPCIMCVQYIGGCSVHRGVFSTSGGYHEYIGGIS